MYRLRAAAGFKGGNQVVAADGNGDDNSIRLYPVFVGSRRRPLGAGSIGEWSPPPPPPPPPPTE